MKVQDSSSSRVEQLETRGNDVAITEATEISMVWKELILLWLSTLLAIKLLVFLYKGLGIHEVVLGLVPLLFIYAPVWLCSYRNVDSYSYRLFVPGFSDWRSWLEACKLAGILNIGLWIWFVPLYWGYYQFVVPIVFGVPAKTFIGTLPEELILTVLYQVFYVALPEEFFYRGYLQTRLNEVFERRWTVFGAKMGMGTIYANVFFAFGHSIVQFQWWHFATFFPGMLFAWAREKSNGVLAGALFHAACNVGIILLDTAFGLRSPI